MTVRNVGLVNVDVTGGGNDTRALVGHSGGEITASYALGKVNDVQGGANGLVGASTGTVTDS